MLLVFGACAGTLRPVQVHRMKIRRHLIRALSANRQKSAFCKSRTAGLFKPRGSRLSRAFCYPFPSMTLDPILWAGFLRRKKARVAGRRSGLFLLIKPFRKLVFSIQQIYRKDSNIPRTPPIVNRGSSGTPPALKFGKTTRLQPE